jgi:hypothetical protein
LYGLKLNKNVLNVQQQGCQPFSRQLLSGKDKVDNPSIVLIGAEGCQSFYSQLLPDKGKVDNPSIHISTPVEKTVFYKPNCYPIERGAFHKEK